VMPRSASLHVAVREPVAQVPWHRHHDHHRWEAETGRNRTSVRALHAATTMKLQQRAARVTTGTLTSRVEADTEGRRITLRSC
jgi:hypothetical protein